MASFMSFLRKQESKKKHKYSKFLKLKARFISLYDGFLLSQE
ncbi:hypothetical protein RFEPED_0862 [Rickettsia felis str. Pedreira]|uniref:Uncharacterized protein n=2 Tax=Rickettsia felis TaxID=42862 RepID=A0A0F3MS37_RICFI|nr:unknown [Rickettsia felis URRWXCal2]KJV58481.1 hypothetical protein RFEPED_0862 [Rickettsia felis str. Pedreira]